MIQTDRNREKTDRAWSKLYDRLDGDGLLSPLPATVGTVRNTFVYWKWGIAAAVFLGVCTFFTVVGLLDDEASNFTRITQVNNEPTTLITTLEDGSIVYMGADSRLEYPEHFQANQREVQLTGEALFDIAPNRERPFRIETSDVTVEVLGTAFNVRSGASHPFQLAVQRGKVRVTLKASGQQATVGAGKTVTLLSQQLHLSDTKDTEQFAAYTRQFRFKDQRLADILRVINLNEPGVSLQTSAQLGERLLTVSFSNDSPQSMVSLICMALHLKYTCKQDTILISE